MCLKKAHAQGLVSSRINVHQVLSILDISLTNPPSFEPCPLRKASQYAKRLALARQMFIKGTAGCFNLSTIFPNPLKTVITAEETALVEKQIMISCLILIFSKIFHSKMMLNSPNLVSSYALWDESARLLPCWRPRFWDDQMTKNSDESSQSGWLAV